ncbi:MAG: GNAT family N-acetyltransferase [Actinomycetota bacterium]
MIDSIEAFRSDLFARYGVDPEAMAQPGLTICERPERRGTGVVSAYVFGPHVIVLSDPAYLDAVADFDPGEHEADGIAPLERYFAFATERGAELLGMGTMRVLSDVPQPADGVDGLVVLDRDQPDHVTRLQTFLDACSAEDIDAAAIEVDELDPVIRIVEAEPGGPVIAYASAFPDEDFGNRWDIGVLTHPDHRRHGLGAAAVQQLVVDLVADGHVPIYRHDLDNQGSAALATGLGFVPATIIAAARWTSPD